MKVPLVNVNVRAFESALQLREVVLAHVGPVGLVSGVDACMVVDTIVTRHLAAHGYVGGQRVCVKNGRTHVHVLADDIAKGLGVNPLHNLRAGHMRVHVDERDHGRLFGVAAARASNVPVLGVATDVRLVSGHVAAEQHEVIVAHGLTNTVQHEPRAAGCNSILALDFASGHAVLGGHHLEDDHEPNTEGRLGAVHDRVGNNAELLFAVAATPHTALAHLAVGALAADAVGGGDVVDVRALTVCARRAVGPTELLEVEVGVGLRGDFKAQFRDGRGLFMGTFSQVGVTLAPWSERV